ncbi:TlyA family RNA methyltransferase [Mycoplasma phocoeninasale]|uniref:TlyA family RNA methyltransferase n=1 Tax=Mycoplasma phocoeninasale TaxID=2726117 RepID=A0A858U5R5_9MOLU|nr:TlyA family RNA methyltransferase [Mycoplasma phocoeninasale]MBN0970922.1 TlyA family RNA methyltransferase [Mycoplasma phocoeninasale]QJG66583.1 TlyA family RNA methyltransferase [Mycoplasma phocoeninasale]
MKRTILEIIASKNRLTAKESEALIREGKVIVNGERILLPSLKFNEDDIEVIIKNPKKEYVSRGAYKLLGAIEQFSLDITNKVCIDIGSSTGGFVEVLLKNEAKKVYAIDSGTNQLDYSLRINPKVSVHEKTNLKNLKKSMFSDTIDFVTCDVSFISLKHVFLVCKDILEKDRCIMALIKPQFEASSKYVESGGLVKEEHHQYIIDKVTKFAAENNFQLEKIARSPILGEKSKNIEYISLFRKV